MANQNAKILTAEQEAKLRQPIDEYVGKIQDKLDALRVDGTDKVVELLNDIDSLKKDHIYTQQENDVGTNFCQGGRGCEAENAVG